MQKYSLSNNVISMFLPVVLSLMVGIMLLWILKQYRYLSWLEQISLGFVIGLSLGVFTLFFQGITGNEFSLTPMIVIAVILLGYSIYLHTTKGFYKDIRMSFKHSSSLFMKTFSSLYIWKKVILIMVVLYGARKVYMMIGINITMPSVDEDAVAGWDMKTKIFYNHKGLVLDKTNEEFLGTDLTRYPFVGLVDTYLLLPIQDNTNITGLTNIISPIVYILSILLLVGIFYRLTNIFFAGIIAYMFLSMPFLFIHGIGSYWNFISGLLLFIIVFYFIDQAIDGDNTHIVRTILPIGVLFGILRNEGMGILVLLTLFILAYAYIKEKKIFSIKNYVAIGMPLVAFILVKYITSLYPSTFDPTAGSGGLQTGIGMIGAALGNIGNPGVFLAPFVQAFYHPDYNLFFILFTIALIRSISFYKKMRYIIPYVILSLILLGIFLVTLYANVEGLGLLTHFAFIRYPLGVIHLLLFVTGYSLFHLHHKLTSGK